MTSTFNWVLSTFVVFVFLRMLKKMLLLSLLCANYVAWAQPTALPFRKGNKWGFAKDDATIILQPAFDSIAITPTYYRIFNNGIIDGVVDANGQQILPPAFIGVFGNPNHGIYIGNQGTKQTMFDSNGKFIKDVPASIKFVAMAGNYLICKNENNQYSLTDTAFQTITKKTYRSIDYDQYGKCIVVEDEKGFGIIDTNGNEILPCLYEKIHEVEQLLVFENHKTRQYGLVDANGNIICNITCPKDFEMQYLGNGIWQRDNRNGGDYQLFKNDGSRLNKADYSYVGNMKDKLLLCEKNKQYYLVDSTGKETLVPGFKTNVDKLQLLSNGKIRVRNSKGLSYIINHQSKRLSTLNFFEIVIADEDVLSDCYIVVTADANYNFKYGIYNFKQNKWIAEPTYTEITYHQLGQQLLFMAYQGKRKLGVIDEQGKQYWQD